MSAKSGWPAVGGRQWSGRGASRQGADRIGGQIEGRGLLEGFSAAEGNGGGEKTTASQSRGHRWGPSSWGGSTRRRDAWGGVEMIGGGLEWVVHGSSATVSTVVFGVAQEW
jgi:hypothetical protein